MEEILLNPAFLALVGVIFTGMVGLIQNKSSQKKQFYKSNLSLDEQRMRLLRWNQEKYHHARMLMIQNGLGSIVDENLPFEPPKDLMIEDQSTEGD